MNSVVKLLAAAGLLAAASAASAQSTGQWTVAVGLNKITPKVESGDISAPALPHSKGDVNSNTQPVMVFAYGITDNISAEAAIGTPYKHKLYGAGAIEGTGQLGTVQALPPTVFLQYRFFAPSSRVRPYVGIGATYAYFMKETGSGKMTALTNPGAGEPTTFKIDNKLTYSLQAGVSVDLTDRIFANVALLKTKLSTDVHFSSGQQQHMKLDPQAAMLTVGYKF
ncbi:OmpW/AlkL family protein [Massilia horti]|uniref:OmpW family protein n=1 Tax=Massilia horti TaxID=2562153 RepID=A0A4Y9T1R6_9BURK|nr:OmpW family outer membrane protein [Massilia horti]TFW33229.1 OmpW family protein [Massilia horti]